MTGIFMFTTECSLWKTLSVKIRAIWCISALQKSTKSKLVLRILLKIIRISRYRIYQINQSLAPISKYVDRKCFPGHINNDMLMSVLRQYKKLVCHITGKFMRATNPLKIHQSNVIKQIILAYRRTWDALRTLTTCAVSNIDCNSDQYLIQCVVSLDILK